MSNNDITGARLVSKSNTKDYEDGYDRIFRKTPPDIIGECESEFNKVERCVIHDNEKVEND